MQDSTIKSLLSQGFRFKKGLGQNFITDTNLLQAIVRDAEISNQDIVLEVGTGLGTLTKELAKCAKYVYTFEIDSALTPILEHNFADIENIALYSQDILKFTDREIKSIINSDFKVVANIPYYITTPILMRFLEGELPVRSLTFTAQKEVAKRICARPNTSDYGALSLACALWGDAAIKRIVKKEVFYPMPKVDSAVVTIAHNPKFSNLKERDRVSKLIKSAFHMRRKTLINNLAFDFGIAREQLVSILADYGIPEKARGEQLPLEAYISLGRDARFWSGQ